MYKNFIKPIYFTEKLSKELKKIIKKKLKNTIKQTKPWFDRLKESHLLVIFYRFSRF